MLKRIWLFLLTNIAVIVLISIIIYIVEAVFWIKISWYSSDYSSVLIYSAIVWFTWAFISLFISKWMAKRAYNIEIITKEKLFSLTKKEKLVYDVVERLANQNGIKMPEVGIYESDEPNAFATWATKNSSLVAVSTWLLDNMDEGAIEWVIGHEMAHILNWDMITMTLLQWVINTFVVFASKILANIASGFVKEEMAWIVRIVVDIILQILFWILASLIVMKFSRYREFKADAGSAMLVWKEKMIAWLKALKVMQERMLTDDSDKMATMKIWSKSKSWFMALFSSHPDLDDRIKALEELRV